ncbi:MAG: mandelate racemase/muconate lactonizing enzyme family protein [Thermomicrobiales bacterium]
MKITAVTCHLCRATNPAGYEAGAAIIRVETDEGVTGHGEALMGLFCGEVTAAITRYYEPLLVGQDPAAIDALWQLMFDSSVWWGRSGAAPSVFGAIEVALWDIAGQRAGKPCYALLAETPRATVPVYASMGAAPGTPEDASILIRELIDEGFRGLKIGLTFGDSGHLEWTRPRGDALCEQLGATLAAIREAAGDEIAIGVDGHTGGIPDPIARDEALAVARVLERYDVSFFEEPLSYLDPAGYAWLRQNSTVRISGGESLTLREGFATFTDLDALDLLQPDVNYVGGFGQAVAVAKLAEERGLGVMPHAWCGGPGFVANVHLALAFDVVERLEMPRQLTDLQAAALIDPPLIRDGLLHAPTAPGLGIAFDPAMAQQFPFPPGLAERASGLMYVPPNGGD